MILMKLEIDMEVKIFSIFGDYDVVIHKIKGCYKMGNINFHLKLDQIKKMETLFSNISYHYACREPKTRVDDLSK